MSSLEVAFLLGVVVVVALGVGWWLSSTFLASKQDLPGFILSRPTWIRMAIFLFVF
jgi:hypothetical protein